jgi:hypothetical protein
VTVAWPAEAYAVKRGLGRCIGFSALSFGAWSFYWFYVNRRLLDGELAQGRDDALLHTLGLFVPVLNVFITYWLWRDLNALRRRIGLPEFPVVPYTVGAIFLAPVFYCIVLSEVNEYWNVRLPGWAREAPVTTAEKVVIGIGIGIWVLWLAVIALTILLLVLSEGASS